MNKLVLAALVAAVASAAPYTLGPYDPIPVGSQPYFDTFVTLWSDVIYTDTYFAGPSPVFDLKVTPPSE